MKCSKCGMEVEEGVAFCTNCGAKIEPETAPYEQQNFEGSGYTQPEQTVNSSVTDYLLSLNNPLFLTLCILLTVSAGTAILSGTINLFATLFAIFMWIIYSRSKKGYVDVANMRRVSGTVYAMYVVNWVLTGIIAVAGVIATVGLSAISTTAVIDAIKDKINVASDIERLLTGSLAGVLGAAIGIVFVLSAVVVAVINLCGIRPIHKFVKSLYISAGTGSTTLADPSKAKNWLLVFGILDAISTLGSISKPMSFVSNGCLAAAYIIGYVIVKKGFVQHN